DGSSAKTARAVFNASSPTWVGSLRPDIPSTAIQTPTEIMSPATAAGRLHHSNYSTGGSVDMPRKMTDLGVKGLKPRVKRWSKSAPELRGHWIRIQPTGKKSFWAVTNNPDGKQIWTFVGAADAMGIEDARDRARTILQRVRDGLPALTEKAESFGAV